MFSEGLERDQWHEMGQQARISFFVSQIPMPVSKLWLDYPEAQQKGGKTANLSTILKTSF